MAKRVRFKTSAGVVSFVTKKKKSKGRSSPDRRQKGRFEVWSIHDEGERQVLRWKGTTEAAGEKAGRYWSADRGMLVDLLRIDGKKKTHLRSFGG